MSLFWSVINLEPLKGDLFIICFIDFKFEKAHLLTLREGNTPIVVKNVEKFLGRRLIEYFCFPYKLEWIKSLEKNIAAKCI